MSYLFKPRQVGQRGGEWIAVKAAKEDGVYCKTPKHLAVNLEEQKHTKMVYMRSDEFGPLMFWCNGSYEVLQAHHSLRL